MAPDQRKPVCHGHDIRAFGRTGRTRFRACRARPEAAPRHPLTRRILGPPRRREVDKMVRRRPAGSWHPLSMWCAGFPNKNVGGAEYSFQIFIPLSKFAMMSSDISDIELLTHGRKQQLERISLRATPEKDSTLRRESPPLSLLWGSPSDARGARSRPSPPTPKSLFSNKRVLQARVGVQTDFDSRCQ